MDKSVFLTFDMDWAIDEVLDDFMKLIRMLGVKATVHVTHDTEYIKKFRMERDKYELGIHPNYNPLLYAHDNLALSGGYSFVLSELKKLVPEAVCCRSHTLTDSSIIAAQYDRYGIKYDLNKFIPLQRGMKIFPWRSPDSNSIVLPFIFEDDVYLNDSNRMTIKELFDLDFTAPMIFNFHPIHLFLNTETMGRYEKSKLHFRDYKHLRECINKDNYGVRNIFEEVVAVARSKGIPFKMISEGEWE